MHDRDNPASILTTNQAAARLGVQPQTLRAWRMRGGGPRFVRLGIGKMSKVGYRLSELEEWVGRHTFGSTSEEVGG